MGDIHDLRELVREANPIAEVVGETIALHRHGSRLVGAHHTHNSASGTSFHVDPDQGLYYCFNCHEGGDVFSWIMRLHRCSFSEALQLLARRARLPLPEWTDEERARHQGLWAEREALRAMYLAAAQFYHSRLTPDLQAWCGERWGLRPDTLVRFQIGFAPVDSKVLWHYLRAQGFDAATLQQSGLFVKVGNAFVDVFQGRLIFPYWSALPLDGHGGEVVYFIGRQTPHTPKAAWEQGKYKKLPIHSERHPYISEAVSNRWFYGEHCLREARGKDVLVTEGVTDALAALQVEIPCMSPATTSFRDADWPRLTHLVQSARRAIIINDAEANRSGERGALKTAAHLCVHGIDARVGTLPRPEEVPKIDVADYLKSQTSEDLRQLMAEARPILDLYLKRVREAPDVEKLEAAETVLPLIACLPVLERDRAEKALQQALGGASAASLPAIRKAVAATAAPHGGDHQLSQKPAMTTAPALPEIDAGDHDLPQVMQHAWDALLAANEPPFLFRQGGLPARIEQDDEGEPLVKLVTPDRLRHALARAARWYRRRLNPVTAEQEQVPALPPWHVVKDVLATPDPPLPILARLVRAPVFAGDGTLHMEPGYHRAGQLYYVPVRGLRLRQIPAHPTAQDIQRARELILIELLGDFPFSSAAGKAHAVALLLLPFARDLIIGPTPPKLVIITFTPVRN